MKLVEGKDFINFVRIKRIDWKVAKKNICSNKARFLRLSVLPWRRPNGSGDNMTTNFDVMAGI